MPKPPPETKQPTSSDLIRSSQTALAFEVLGDRWRWLIIRDLFLGFRRFEELRRRTGAARGTLTSRLNKLIQHGVAYKHAYQSGPIRYEYRLTDKGYGLFPLCMLVWAWETKWTQDHDKLPDMLFHRACGRSTHPELRCPRCQQVIDARDVDYVPGPGAKAHTTKTAGSQRRRQPKTPHAEGVDSSFFHTVDIMADRWTGMVLAAIWFRKYRYDDIAETIGIATNILSDRLKGLTDAGVLERRAYRTHPTRYEYRLTEKGRDLYGFTLMLHQWADEWLVGPEGPGLHLHHKCGERLGGIVTCSECGRPLDRGEVSYGYPAG